MNKEIEKKISVLDDLTHWGTINLDNGKLRYFGHEIFKVDALLPHNRTTPVQHNINLNFLVPINIQGYNIYYFEGNIRKEKILTSSINHHLNSIKGINYGSKTYHPTEIKNILKGE